MSHQHEVRDSDLHFTVDAITREISNNSSKIMQYDHRSECFTFDIPRYIDNHDMSTCNRVEIHYLNVGGGQDRNAGVYVVDDLGVSTDDEDVVFCSWTLTDNATRFAGTLNFILRFVCLTDDVVDYAWHTAPYSGISIVAGIHNTEIIVEQYADVLAEWESRITALEQGGSVDLSELESRITALEQGDSIDLSEYATLDYLAGNYVTQQYASDSLINRTQLDDILDERIGAIENGTY